MLDKKIRVSSVKDFPNGNPVIIYVDSLDEAKELVERLSDKAFQSEQFPLPGSYNLTAIEVFNDKDGGWDIYVEKDSTLQ